MAPAKCNYLIFPHNVKTGSQEKLDLKLYGESIDQHMSNELILLGITFDKALNFNAHIQHLQQKTQDRSNIIKILSKKSGHF